MSKDRIGHLNSSFTYIIMGKGARPAGRALPRILRVLYKVNQDEVFSFRRIMEMDV
jgi:hypothetical protein